MAGGIKGRVQTILAVPQINEIQRFSKYRCFIVASTPPQNRCALHTSSSGGWLQACFYSWTSLLPRVRQAGDNETASFLKGRNHPFLFFFFKPTSYQPDAVTFHLLTCCTGSAPRNLPPGALCRTHGCIR